MEPKNEATAADTTTDPTAAAATPPSDPLLAAVVKQDEATRALEELDTLIEEAAAKRAELLESIEKSVVTTAAKGKLAVYKCPGCGKVHFRHAGYLKLVIPFHKPTGERGTGMEDKSVMVCVACKKSYVYTDGQAYDVSDQIDLNAWEKTEVEAHRATGPGGQC